MSSRMNVVETSMAKLAPFGPTVLRVGLGAVFLAHAYAKVAVFTLPGTEQFFRSFGFPGWSAYAVFVAEAVGGALLVLGMRTRLVALALLPILAGAMLVHLPNGWSFTAAGGGWEYVAFLMVALVVQSLVGDGVWAIARSRDRERRDAAPTHETPAVEMRPARSA
jgi:putative oxidoreductase